MSQHSKGQWTASEPRESEPCFAQVNASNWYGFARVVVRINGENKDSPQGRANLALILAAPALLRQLRKAYRELVRVGYDPKHTGMKSFRKTINEARGKA